MDAFWKGNPVILEPLNYSKEESILLKESADLMFFFKKNILLFSNFYFFLKKRKLRHPNILPIWGLHQLESVTYLVTERMVGAKTLKSYLTENDDIEKDKKIDM